MEERRENMEKRIVLASASPRRAELLGRLTGDFNVEESGADETYAGGNPAKLARILAERKAADVFSRNPDAVVIGADTVVALGGRIFGKPRDEADARSMLRLLSGRQHVVYTGVCVLSARYKRVFCSRTKVQFDTFSQQETDAYIASGDWADKAGAYGIQGTAAKYIRGIKGDYYNVVGLPLNTLYKLLKDLEERL